jgi:DNA-3-methyladenine glycosylase
LDPVVLAGPVEEVAPRVLGTLLQVDDGRCGRVVEVEAYDGADDPASHAYRGPSARNASMFGPAGGLYVYRSYGLHWCANVVLGEVGRASAVLLRAIEPIDGIERMRAARPAARRDLDLTNGPGKLCAALGITGDDDGTDLLDPRSRVRLCSDGTPPPTTPRVTTRVGITRAVDRAWRFADPDSAFVSTGRPSGG